MRTATQPIAPPSARAGYRHYRSLLDAENQAAYDALRGGIARFDRAVKLPGRLDQKSLQLVFQGLKLDEPELFYVSELALTGPASGIGRMTALPRYTMTQAEAERAVAGMRAAGDRILQGTEGLDDASRLARLHDGLATAFVYDPSDDRHAHEATGALLFGRGVCDSASKAMKYLCDRCGIPAIVAIGHASVDPGGFSPVPRAQAPLEPHAWNLVRMRDAGTDVWYHLDVTHDALMSTECPRYDYFCLGDEDVSSDHVLSAEAYYPRCPRSFGYYPRIGRYAATKSELGRIARQARATGENPLVFQLPRMRGADEGFAQRVMELVSDDMAAPSFAPTVVRMESNPSQMVFQVKIEKAGVA